MEFDKYRLRGDYHWHEFWRNSIYRQHALYVQSWIREKTGLDAGCGDGLITHLLGPGWSGIDPDSVAIGHAVRHGVHATEGSVYHLNGNHEAVYLGDVLEHLEYPERALVAIGCVTSILYLATPPRHGNKLGKHHLREWTEEELPIFLAESGWKIDGTIVTQNERMYGKFLR